MIEVGELTTLGRHITYEDEAGQVASGIAHKINVKNGRTPPANPDFESGSKRAINGLKTSQLRRPASKALEKPANLPQTCHKPAIL
jgi:hypothetical protein